MKNLTLIIIVSIILALISSFLIYLIPSDSGMAALGMIGTIWVFTFLLSVIALALLYFIKFRKEKVKGKILIIAFVLIIILPLVLGSFLPIIINSFIYQYYNSPSFISSYSNKIGIEVIPLNYTSKFAYCSLINHTRSYKLNLKNDELLFFSAEFSNYNIENYFEEKFEEVEFFYSSPPLVRRIGAYKVPKGEYILNIPNVYNLHIYHTDPLITPSGIIIKDYNYPLIFKEDFSMSDFNKKTKKFKESTCSGTIIKGVHNFVNDFILIPNAKINIYDGNDTIMIYYFEPDSGSRLRKIKMLKSSDDQIIEEEFKLKTGGIKYKEVTNKYTGQVLTFYVIIDKNSYDYDFRYGSRDPMDHDYFEKNLVHKEFLSNEYQVYLHRRHAKFYVDSPIDFNEFQIYFENEISAYSIDNLVHVIENMEPSKIKTFEWQS